MNIPNLLTVFRILLIPAFIYVFFNGGEHHFLFAALIFLLAGFTDVLDGYLARKWNQITNFGKMFDPVADKAMILSVLVCLMVAGLAPWWLIAILLLKELCMVVGGLLLYKNNETIVPANKYGKLATVVLYVVIFALIMIKNLPYAAQLILMIAAVFFSLLAFFSYLQNYRRIRK